MRDECEAAGHDPALRALGRCAAVLLPVGDGAPILLHDAGADPGARRALGRLSLDAAVCGLPEGAFDAEGLAPDASPLLDGLEAPTCAARRAERGGLIVLAAWAPDVRRVAMRAAFDALERRIRWHEGRPPTTARPSSFEAVFENATHCMAVLGADRRLHAVNRAGRRVLAEARLLADVGGRLRALDPAQDRRLGEALRQGTRGEAPSVALLTASPGAPGLRCEIGRIDLPPEPGPSEPGGAASGPRFLLTAAPIAASAPVEALLSRAFGLTHAEARLAAALVAGHDLRAAGERLGVSHHTARKYLQIAFSKMGVRRQADLVRRALEIVHDPAASAA